MLFDAGYDPGKLQYDNREANLAPLKKVCWRMRRSDHKGQLIHIKKHLRTHRFHGRVSELHTLQPGDIPVGVVVLVVDYIPVRRTPQFGSVKELFAFLVLHGEHVYLVEDEELERNDKVE